MSKTTIRAQVSSQTMRYQQLRQTTFDTTALVQQYSSVDA